MKMSEWLVLVGVIAVPLFACSSSDSSGTGGYAGGTGGAAGTGGAVVGGSGGGVTGGSGGGVTGGSGGGVTGGSGGGTVMTECQASSWNDPACGTCMETSCASQCEACLTDADCTAWAQCATQCADQACWDGCGTSNPNGVTKGEAWIGSTGCFGVTCGTDCGGGTGGGICDSGLTTNNADCDTCLGDNCCDAVKTCQADTACNDCLMNGTQDSCGGNANYAAMDTCWGGTCGTACAGGGACGLSTNGANPACDTCIETNCCDQGLACVNGPDANTNGSPDCIDVLDCIQACASGDTACEDACVTAQPEGGQLLNDFFGCLSQSCATDCQ